MSVLGHERWLLREAYIRADEALEMLSSELAKDEQHWVADTSLIYKQHAEPKDAIAAISSHLATKPIGIFENPTVTRALGQTLYNIHAAGDRLSLLNHTAEIAISEVRDISIQTTPEAIGSRDDRGQGRGRPVPVSDDLHGQRDGAERGHLRGPHPNPIGY
jgi:hypothetical protein